MNNFRSMMLALALSQFATVAQAGQITVSGQGRVDGAPDMARISMGVTSQAETAAQALNENSAATGNLLQVVAAQGVEPQDIQTSGLSLSPLWTSQKSSLNGERQIAGYVVRNQVTVRVLDLDALGGILDQVVQGGANGFDNLSFGLRDPQPAMDEARRLAVADALRKGALYAQAAGVGLGELLSLDETGRTAPAPIAARQMMASDAVPIAQGQVSVQSSVTMVFQIQE